MAAHSSLEVRGKTGGREAKGISCVAGHDRAQRGRDMSAGMRALGSLAKASGSGLLRIKKGQADSKRKARMGTMQAAA